jgi:hypothetical protein
MASKNVADGPSAASWPQLSSGPLLVGGVLAGVGALLALSGAAVVVSHVVVATRAWVKELETPPDQLARLKWDQAKSAALAGADSWRKHPNAKVRLTTRASA